MNAERERPDDRFALQRRALVTAALAAPAASVVAAPASGLAPVGSPGRGRFPNVLLTTHAGQRVRFYDDVLSGNKINIVNMMYTQCPEVCGGTMVNLARVQRLLADRMGRDVFIWSVTLDPLHDTPAVLQRYAEIIGAAPGWTFLSGRPVDIERVRRAMGFTDRDPVVDRTLSQHIGMLRIGNDAVDRWMSTPGIAQARQIAQEALWIGLARRA